jgi:hypothetical protein
MTPLRRAEGRADGIVIVFDVSPLIRAAGGGVAGGRPPAGAQIRTR